MERIYILDGLEDKLGQLDSQVMSLFSWYGSSAGMVVKQV